MASTATGERRTEKYEFRDEDVNKVADNARRTCGFFVISVLLVLLDLGEVLFTTFYFDEDEFDFFFVALVIGFFALFDTIAKSIVACTKTLWDDFIVDLLSEGVQGFMYIYLCNFSDISIFWLSIMGGSQILLTTVRFCALQCCSRNGNKDHDKKHGEEYNDNDDDDDAEEAGDEDSADEALRCAICCISCITKCCMPSCFAMVAAVAPILYLLTQEESPFRTKTFELILAIYLWAVEVGLKATFDTITSQLGDVLQEAANGDDDDDDDEAPEEAKAVAEDGTAEADDTEVNSNERSGAAARNQPRLNPEDAADRGLTSVLQVLLLVAYISFFIYLSVLGWMWWFDPDIEDTYDKVVTMLLILSIPCMCCAMCCQACAKDESAAAAQANPLLAMAALP